MLIRLLQHCNVISCDGVHKRMQMRFVNASFIGV